MKEITRNGDYETDEDLRKRYTDLLNMTEPWWSTVEGFYSELCKQEGVEDVLIAECYSTYKIIFCVDGGNREQLVEFIYKWSIWPIKYIVHNGEKIIK